MYLEYRLNSSWFLVFIFFSDNFVFGIICKTNGHNWQLSGDEPASCHKNINTKNVLQLKTSMQKMIKPMLLNDARPLTKDDAQLLTLS